MNHSLLFQKSYDAYRTVSNLTDHFPKKDRYSLGEKIEQTTLDLLEYVITAEVTVPSLKDIALVNTAIKADICSVLIRLALDRHLIKETNYFALASSFSEIAKMAIAWRKSNGQR